MIAPKEQKRLSTNQTTVMLVMVAVVVWVVGLIISRSVLGVILFNNEVIGRKRAVDSTLTKNLQSVEELKSQFGKLNDAGVDKDKVLRALPDSYDVPSLASRMEGLLLDSFVSFDSFSLINNQQTDGSSVGSGGVQELTFAIQVSGPYQNVRKMLSNFQQEISPMRIKQIKLTGSESSTSAQLTIVSYYQEHVSLDLKTETLEKK